MGIQEYSLERSCPMETQLNDTSNSKNTLVKSSVLLMVLTIVSKFFGFARETTQAYFFGANINTDAYLVAMTIPSALFLSVSGAVNNVFIPVYDRFRSKGRDKALVCKFTVISLLLCTVVFIVPVFLNTPLVVKLFAPDFPEEGIALAAGMLRILIFVIFFRLLSAVSTAVLHVHRNFLVPGMVGFPIASASWLQRPLCRQHGDKCLIGTVIGVGSQLLVLAPWLARTRMRGAIGDKVSDGLKEIAVLLPPVLAGSLAGELKAMIDKIFASGLAEGSISFLNYAVRINGLPTGLLVTSVITVLYPTLVAHSHNQQWQQYKSAVANALNVLTFIMLPITAGFAILALPITQLVYMRGSFDYHAAVATAYALRFYSPILLGTMLYQLMLKAHYAIKDTKTPFLAMLISVFLNIVFNAILIRFWTHGGLALATALATIAAALFMYFRLCKNTGQLLNRETLTVLGKSALATLAMATVCLAAYSFLAPHMPAAFWGRLVDTSASITLSATVYFALALVMKISAMREVLRLVAKIKDKLLLKKAA